MPTPARRITLVIHALSGGGAERQISSLANQLSRHGAICTLVTLADATSDRFTVDPEVMRVELNAMHESHGLWQAFAANRQRVSAVREAILASQPDCVISFCDKMNIIALAACHPLTVPVIISERSDPRQQKLGMLWEASRRWYYPTCTACVVQTSSIANYLRPIVGPQSLIEIIPTACDRFLDTASNAPIDSVYVQRNDKSLADESLRLVYVGRLSFEKGPDRLVEAWSALVAKFPSWKLVFVGDGPLEDSLRQRCKSLGIDRQVEFLGWRSDVRSILQSASAFVLPSRYEGFPGALLEAMDSGLPIVAVDCSASIGETIEHERSGLIAENSLESLTSNIDRLLSDTSLRKQFSLTSQVAVENYTWPKILPQWQSLIEKVRMAT